MTELERLLFGALIVVITSGKKFQWMTKLVDVSGKGNEIFKGLKVPAHRRLTICEAKESSSTWQTPF